MLKLLIAAFVAVFALTVNAQASTDHRYDQYGPVATINKATQHRAHRVKHAKRHHASHHPRYATHGRARASRGEAQILSHPAGCPASRFCGCGVSVKVFGRPIRDLYLAANWRRFPLASPARGMVAWRYGHVFYIEDPRDGRTVLAYDPNSGGHQTRLHLRSLAGYRVVNPNGSRYAQN